MTAAAAAATAATLVRTKIDALRHRVVVRTTGRRALQYIDDAPSGLVGARLRRATVVRAERDVDRYDYALRAAASHHLECAHLAVNERICDGQCSGIRIDCEAVDG